jgi:Ala-tRNA(Pro) deacylase
MPATRNDLLARFRDLGIETTTRDHPPAYTVEEAQALRGEIPGGHCKNLFLKDDKGAIWLIVCLEEAQVDLKAAPAKIGSRRLSFGRPELLREILGVEPGSVTPLENTATTTIRSADLVAFIRACGHEPAIVAVA